MRDEIVNLKKSAEEVASCDPALRGEAWNALFERFNPFIRGHVIRALRRYRRPGAFAEVSDLVQQVYERLIAHDYRALRHFRGQREPAWRAYLARICHNRVADWYQRATPPLLQACAAESFPLEEPGVRFHPSVEPMQEDALLRREIRDLTESILRRMGDHAHAERDRLVFRLRHYQDWSAEEVAQKLQITVPHVNIIYHRVRRRILLDLSKALSSGAERPLTKRAARRRRWERTSDSAGGS